MFRRGSKKKSKPRFTGLCEGNSPVTAQRASNAKMLPFDDVIMQCHDCWRNQDIYQQDRRLFVFCSENFVSGPAECCATRIDFINRLGCNPALKKSNHDQMSLLLNKSYYNYRIFAWNTTRNTWIIWDVLRVTKMFLYVACTLSYVIHQIHGRKTYNSNHGGQFRDTDKISYHLRGCVLLIQITLTQVMIYHWWIPCETLVHTGSR